LIVDRVSVGLGRQSAFLVKAAQPIKHACPRLRSVRLASRPQLDKRLRSALAKGGRSLYCILMHRAASTRRDMGGLIP
jgi:hypothetical protein